jgi:hypothetical protein
MSHPSRPTDREYFEGRAADHRARADACADKQIAKIHVELARNYDDLASVSDSKPKLRLVMT